MLSNSLFYILALFQNTTFLLPDKGGDKSFVCRCPNFLQRRDIQNRIRIFMQAIDLLKIVSEISVLSFWC